jgi:hypothetical protein
MTHRLVNPLSVKKQIEGQIFQIEFDNDRERVHLPRGAA